MTVRTLGKKFKSLNLNNPFVAYPLIAPGDNPNGTIMRSLTATGIMVISATTPTWGYQENMKYLNVPSTLIQYNDLLIPAGSGLFVYFSNEFTNAFSMSWDVLNADGTVA